MPNPKHSLHSKEGKRMARRLSPKQQGLLRGVRKRGLSPALYYRRSGNKTGVSVHVPSLDMKRNLSRKRGKQATIKSTKTVKRYPHAYETARQAGAKKRTIKRALKTKKKINF